MSYAVIDDAASLAGLQSGEVTSAHGTLADTLVDALMNRVRNSGDGFSTIAVTDEVYDIPIQGTRTLLLNGHPITTLTSVKVDFQTSSPTTLDSSNYIEENGIIKLVTPPSNTASIQWVSSFPKGHGSVAVSYTYGYSSTPALIIQLANIIAGKLGKLAVEEAARPASGVSRIRIGDYEEAYGNNPAPIINMLDNSEEVLMKIAINQYRKYEF